MGTRENYIINGCSLRHFYKKKFLTSIGRSLRDFYKKEFSHNYRKNFFATIKKLSSRL